MSTATLQKPHTTKPITPTLAALRDRAVLVHLEIRRWQPTKNDRRAGKHLVDHFKVQDPKLIRARKTLLRTDGALKDIQQYAGQARARVLAYTTPWDAGGFRLLPNEYFLKLHAELRADKDGFERSVRTFLSGYEDDVKLAESMLRELYDLQDYPSVDVLAHRFLFRVESRPIPDKTHLQTELADQIQKAVIESMEEQFETRVAGVRRDLFERIVKVLDDPTSGLITRLARVENAAPASDDDKKRAPYFTASIMDGVKELIEILPGLNLSNDPELTIAVERMRKQLAPWDRDTLIADGEIREFVLEQATEIRDDAKARVEELVSAFGG